MVGNRESCTSRRQSGSWPETGLEEINGDLLEADFLGTWDRFDDRTTLADFSLPIACPDLDYFRFADDTPGMCQARTAARTQPLIRLVVLEGLTTIW
jgi:hypothetical protein